MFLQNNDTDDDSQGRINNVNRNLNSNRDANGNN